MYVRAGRVIRSRGGGYTQMFVCVGPQVCISAHISVFPASSRHLKLLPLASCSPCLPNGGLMSSWLPSQHNPIKFWWVGTYYISSCRSVRRAPAESKQRQGADCLYSRRTPVGLKLHVCMYVCVSALSWLSVKWAAQVWLCHSVWRELHNVRENILNGADSSQIFILLRAETLAS